MEYLFDTIKTDIHNEYMRCHPPKGVEVVSEEELDEIATQIYDDLEAFAERDPAAQKSKELIYCAYFSFRAVYYYRIANFLYRKAKNCPIDWFGISARRLSEVGKVVSGIEINPGAKIGKRFIIDHGVSTVIGETAEIGDDCYVLQGVTLGARGISGNPIVKRHPTIGNNVQIGGHVQIIGDITIGDNVFISPNSCITTNIPNNTRVSIVNQLQIVKNEYYKGYMVFGVVPFENQLLVYGKGLSSLSCCLSFENEKLTLGTQILNDFTMLIKPVLLNETPTLHRATLQFSQQGAIIITVLGISNLLSFFH